MMWITVIVLSVVLVLLVAIRYATANFQRLEMGAYFKLTARDLKPKAQDPKPEDSL